MATSAMAAPPTFPDIADAARRIADWVVPTPVLHSASLAALAGASLHFKCENFQHAGAFKFRGASNTVAALNDAEAARGVATHSSGNHGAALALAARKRGIPAHVVVPKGATATKVAAIEAFGGHIHWCAPTQAAREAMAEAVCRETGARFVHPNTDPLVIAGQGTAAVELLRDVGSLDALVVPVGGGGLAAGTTIAAGTLAPALRVFGAEPAGADDAARALESGVLEPLPSPRTICDGLRTTLGAINYAVLRQHCVQVLRVADDDTIAAMRLLWERLKIIVEPSSAIAFAAVCVHREHFAGKRVGVILSGGNVDLDALPWINPPA